MGYDKKVATSARAELTRRKQDAESLAAANLQDFFLRCPQAAALKQQMAQNGVAAARAVLAGGDVRAALEKLKAQGLSLNRQYEELLRQNGLSRQDVTPQYTCPLCQDTGFVDGKMCQCYRLLRKQAAYRQLSDGLPLAASTFQSFSLAYYQGNPQAYQQMQAVLQTCQSYASRFRPHSSSLLFWGGTGLGKTHLSLAIANTALDKGFGVVYGSVQGFTSAFEKERFDRDDSNTADALKGCDLLILDDLGAEGATNYLNAVLYDVVNCRMLASRPTIISTNLNLRALESRYGQRFTSRVFGSYSLLEFMGQDVRQQKREGRR